MNGQETYRSEQEKFWAGQFGDKYIGRNSGPQLLASNVAFFSRALHRCGTIDSCIELGANVGMNLMALKTLYPLQKQKAVEINSNAALALQDNLPDCKVLNASILDVDTEDWGGRTSLSSRECSFILAPICCQKFTK